MEKGFIEICILLLIIAFLILSKKIFNIKLKEKAKGMNKYYLRTSGNKRYLVIPYKNTNIKVDKLELAIFGGYCYIIVANKIKFNLHIYKEKINGQGYENYL